MTIPEFIGFLITLFALAFLFLKQLWDARERRKNPEKYEKKQLETEKRLKQFMKSLNIETHDDDDDEERKLALAISRKLKPPQTKNTNSNAHQKQSRRPPSSPAAGVAPAPVTRHRLDALNLQMKAKGVIYSASKEQNSVAAKLIQQQKSMKDVILLREIIGPPRSVQFGTDPDRHY